MDKYKNVNKLNDKSFKRIIGVKRLTYKVMLEFFKKYSKDRRRHHGIPGRQPKVFQEHKLLFMPFNSYREYRSLAHMGFDYALSEAVGSKLV